MALPTVLIYSKWRNDADKRLHERAQHLLSKTYPNLYWLWGVGDSQDETREALLRYELDSWQVAVFTCDSGLDATTTDERLVRICTTDIMLMDKLAQMLSLGRWPTPDYILFHESDLQTPLDIVERLLATGKPVVGGWPTLGEPEDSIFYDTWAYRGLDGRKFANTAPYHPDARPDTVFEVSSLGSVVLAPYQPFADGLRPSGFGALVEICQKLRALGYSCWVDPSIPVVQPRDLWEPVEHGSL